MRAEQAQLQLLGQLLGDLLRHEAAEAGVHAVGVLVRAVRGVLDDARAPPHLCARVVGEQCGRAPLDGDLPDVFEREVVAGQRVGHGHTETLVPASAHSGAVSDPIFDQPRELELPPGSEPRTRALELLRRTDFRRLYLAVAASELGDSLHYIALMWFALESGGPLGVIAVRLADSIPALVFGLHGGLAADRWSRKWLMVSSDLVRGVVLVPIAIAGIAGCLPLWGLVVAAFVLETATSYFAPAYGATVPTLVDRENVQQANALVQATAQSLSIGGWALAAALLAFIPVSVFFAVNAASFFVSAALIARLRHGRRARSARRGAAPARGLRRPAPTTDARGGGRGARGRGDDHRGHVDRRRADARTRHASPRRRRVLHRDGRLRGRVDRERGGARAYPDPEQSAREPDRMGDVPARLRPDRTRDLVAARGRRRVLRGDRTEHVRRAAQLGGAGGGTRQRCSAACSA